MLGWTPFRWVKRYIKPEYASEYVAGVMLEYPAVSILGTGTPPFAQMSAFPLGGAVPMSVGVVPTGVGLVHGQFDLTPLIDPPV